MSEFLVFILPPLLACLLLIAINVYFGIHVIKREIIFIDIALAQIAALGATVAAVIQATDPHEDEKSLLAYLFSLLFVTAAAGMFTLLKSGKLKVPLEALIGITFAVATTASVIILDKSAGTDVHIHDMLIGSILWVTWGDILRLTIWIVLVAAIHFVFRKPMMHLTDHYHDPDHSFRGRRFWDFLFYFSFGLIIIEAVQVAGILTVFAFLIIPASIALLITDSWIGRIVAGLLFGITSIIPGLLIAWTHDLPASPLIIGILAIMLTGVSVYVRLSRRKNAKK